MTPRQAEAEARRWIKKAKPLLGLTNWYIEVAKGEKPEDSDALASINPLYERHYATVRIGTGYLGLEPWERRQTLVHELIHCLMAQTWAAFDDVEEYVGDTSWGHLTRNFTRQAEILVDDLSVLLAPHLPEV